MKYYSDLTQKIYETEEDLKKAEKELNEKLSLQKKKDEARKQDYQKVVEAYKVANKKREEADVLLAAFLEKYGRVHGTTDQKQFVDAKKYMDSQKDLINIVFSTFPFFI